MSTTIDQKVVEMKFDNRQFESNVSTSMSTIDKLKQKLKFSDSAKGLENLNDSVKNVNMSGLGSAIETVKTKFSALEVMGVTALANITNSAVNTGKRMISALTIDPIKTGFQEYETQINSVQTILANTESKGSTLQDVNRALNELNTYADKTIYNFTEMTRNIGTFTAAGVDLKTSTTAIQGIANLAAVSGSTSQQASTAMYQLSQALAAGTVKLMDWNSVVNAGMGGQVFQDALKKTAKAHGTNVDAMIKKNGSFRESLQEGWITADILTETLAKMTKSGAAEYLSKLTGVSMKEVEAAQALAEANGSSATAYDKLAKKMAKSGKISAKEASEILKMADSAENAATKVKTFTQLWDTLQEAAQSGWTKTWEILVGDFGEAKELLTEISDSVSGVINGFSDSRNQLLSGALSTGWKQLLNNGINDAVGFEETVTKVAKKHGTDLSKMITDEHTFQDALKDGWLTSDILTESISDMTKKMSGMSDKQLEAAGYTYKDVEAMKKLNDQVKSGKISMEEYVKLINRPSGRELLIESLRNVIKSLVNVIKPIKEAFGEVFPKVTSDQLYDLITRFRDFTANLKLSDENADKLKRTFKGLFSIIDIFRKTIVIVGKAIGNLFGSNGANSALDLILSVTAAIGDFFTSLDANFNTSGFSKVLKDITDGISKLLSGITGKLDGFSNILSKIGDFVSKIASKIGNGLKEAFSWISENISIGDIFAGLVGGGIFTAAKKFSGLIDKIKDIIENLFSNKKEFSGFLDNIKEVLGSVHDSLNAFTAGIKISSLVAIAVAVMLLSSSLKTLGALKPTEIGKGLFAIGVLLAMLSAEFKSLSKALNKFGSKGIIKTAAALILVAVAIKILAGAMKKIGSLSMAQIAKGLFGIGVALLELSIAVKIINKVKIPLKTSVAIIALAEACKILADAMSKFGSMSWKKIGHGLVGMGGALGELVIASKLLDKVKIKLTTTIALLVLAKSLDDIAEALQQFSFMSWSEIGGGLTAMGGALGELTIVLAILGKIGGFSSLLASISIAIITNSLDEIADAMERFSFMSWSEIGRGLTAMGGALSELGVITGALGYLTGFSGILGAATLWIAVQGLDKLSNVFQKFGSMSWSEIGRGLTAMGGALLEAEGISAGVGALAGLAGILGGATLWVTVQSLDDLANSLKKFGEMDWGEIGRGLTAMGGAMSEVALGGLLNTFSGIGDLAISMVAEPLGVLADSVKKWADVKVPENLGLQLEMLADGVMSFTFGGLGASAIADVAKPLGDMANSVKKWAGVTVPEGLGEKMGAIADGIKKFTFGGLGASAIAKVAEPLGIFAGSIKKWSSIAIPENIGEQIGSIADGVKKFSWLFLAGWSLSTISGPLGELSGDIAKWSNVKIPTTIKDDLTNIADGIKSFEWLFLAGWSLSALSGPLGELTTDINKWNGLTIPTTIKDDLTNIADGIKSFEWLFLAGWSLSAISGPLGTLASSIEKISKANIPSDIKTKLTSFSDGVDILATNIKKSVENIDTGKINSFSSAIGKLNITVSSVTSVDISKINSFITAITELSGVKINASSLIKSADSVSSAINKLMKSISTTISSGKTSINTAMKSAMDGMLSAVKSSESKNKTATTTLILSLSKTISSKKSSITVAFKNLVSGASNAIRSHRSSMESSGRNLGDGLVIGINAKQSAAYNAGYRLGQKAVQGEKDGQKSKSPSKLTIQSGKWFGEGLVIGIDKMGKAVYNAGYGLGDTATNALSSSIAHISDAINSDLDTQPTIRPVLDLSDITSGARSINDLFKGDSTIGVMTNANSISSMMNNRQNGVNNDVISAIKDLKKTMSKSTGNTYNVNGITYDDGSNVTTAVESLVRAAKIERRT